MHSNGLFGPKNLKNDLKICFIKTNLYICSPKYILLTLKTHLPIEYNYA